MVKLTAIAFLVLLSVVVAGLQAWPRSEARRGTTLVTIDPGRGLFRVIGPLNAKLSLQNGSETPKVAELSHSWMQGPVLLVVPPDVPQAYCLFDADTTMELLVFGRRAEGLADLGLPQPMRPMVVRSDLSVTLANRDQIRRAKRQIEAIDGAALRLASVPRIGLGPLSVTMDPSRLIAVLDEIFPYEQRHAACAAESHGSNFRGT